MELEFTIIDAPAAFAEVRDDWNDLARRTEVDHAFMRHEWFTAWLAHVPYEGRPRVLLARRGGRLVGAAPLRLLTARRRGLGVRMLAFMKTGITPRCSFLIDPDEEPAAIFDGLWRIDGWDVAEFKGLVRDDPLTRRFLDHVKSRGVCVVEPGSGSPYQTLPADWEQFEKTRSKGFRKRFRNSNNRCRKADGFELVKIETAAALDEVFDELLEVSRNSWKADGGTDLVTQSGMAEFFRAFARATEDEGLWVVYLMRLEGRAVAFDYYLRHGGRLVGLRWEYDQQYGYYMPGVVVHVAALKDLLASGGVEYDLAGTDTDFKSGLVDSLREHVDVTFGHAGTKSRLLITLKDTLVRSRQAGLLPGGR